ncbi:MAG: hypothetical protein HY537_12575, partial [Deltaproteobacteria bacterium]|nr:hypothetical protein [Deltaproteobacteria bacterium]
RSHCNLAPLPVAQVKKSDAASFETLPTLEIIVAPAFVQSRFQKLKERKFLSVHFYPFQKPNILVTDPEQTIEIFIKAFPEMRFGAIIGERVERMVYPPALYKAISQILRRKNISYFEIINDAADTQGIDYILKAGFVPSAYFPSLKRSGEARRDYVVFGKCYEKFIMESTLTNPHLNYLSEYEKCEKSANCS